MVITEEIIEKLIEKMQSTVDVKVAVAIKVKKPFFYVEEINDGKFRIAYSDGFIEAVEKFSQDG